MLCVCCVSVCGVSVVCLYVVCVCVCVQKRREGKQVWENVSRGRI